MKRLKLMCVALIVAMTLSLAACGGGGGGSDGDGGGGDEGGGTGQPSVSDTDFEVSALANLDGGSFSAGVAINTTGVAVGYADDGTTLKGVKWNVTDPTVAEMLNPLDDDDTRYSAAYGVNASGMTVGESENDTGIVRSFGL